MKAREQWDSRLLAGHLGEWGCAVLCRARRVQAQALGAESMRLDSRGMVPLGAMRVLLASKAAHVPGLGWAGHAEAGSVQDGSTSPRGKRVREEARD